MVIKARPHHICCVPFFIRTFPERGESFEKVEGQIREVLSKPSTEKIKVIEGVDDICMYCPLSFHQQCASPKGGEAQVRKWDSILLSELKIKYETELTADEWQSLIADKIPFKICPKCQWKSECKVGLKFVKGA
jgi:hypothetical protein